MSAIESSCSEDEYGRMVRLGQDLVGELKSLGFELKVKKSPGRPPATPKSDPRQLARFAKLGTFAVNKVAQLAAVT